MARCVSCCLCLCARVRLCARVALIARACVARCADQRAHARNDKKVLPFLVTDSQPFFGKKNEQQVGTHSPRRFSTFETSAQQITRVSTKCVRIAFFAELSSNRATVGNLARWNGRSPHSRAHCAAQAQPRIQNGCMPKRVGLSSYLLRVPFYTGRWSM